MDNHPHLMKMWAYAAFLHPGMRSMPKYMYERVVACIEYPFFKMRLKYDDFNAFWAEIEDDMILDMLRL